MVQIMQSHYLSAIECVREPIADANEVVRMNYYSETKLKKVMVKLALPLKMMTKVFEEN